MKYKIKKEFWDYLAVSGENLKSFRFRVPVCDITFRKIRTGGTITSNALILVQMACQSLIPNFRDFQLKFVEEIVSEDKIVDHLEHTELRNKLNTLNAAGRIKYTDAARYIGVRKQYIYNFLHGHTISRSKKELLENYVSLFA
jgi:hypothetical protein